MGEGANEVGFISEIDNSKLESIIGKNADYLKINKEVIKVDPFYYRPTEVELLIGDASKAQKVLGWQPKYNLDMLVDDMMESDVKLMMKDDYLKKGGFEIQPQIEDIL